ncbi:MAG: hypothetical protein HY873_03335 [Chloroflexi bacterium]|nr:hypothetical protein [Chloroflexota bacterium]
MPGPLSLDIELAASSIRVLALDASGERQATTSAAFETQTPQPGWAEQRPDDWMAALVGAVGALGREVALADVTEIRLGATLHASVFLDGEREVIRTAILATDNRAVAEAKEVERVLGQALAWPAAAHLLWMRRNQAIAFKRVRTLLSPRGYLRFALTGELWCDVEDAAATGLFDLGDGAWSEATCDALEISLDFLPHVDDDGDSSPLLDAAANRFGMRAGNPVIG